MIAAWKAWSVATRSAVPSALRCVDVEALELVDLGVGGAQGGERGGECLQRDAGLDELLDARPGQEAVQRAKSASGSRDGGVGDEGAEALAGLDQPVRAELLEALADGGAADLELARELGLGGQAVARLERAVADRGGQSLGDDVGDPLGGDRVEHESVRPHVAEVYMQVNAVNGLTDNLSSLSDSR